MNRDHQKIRAAITNEVIRAVAALRQQRTVVREQDGQTVFVPGTEAAREYLIETLDRALAGDSTPPATPVERRYHVEAFDEAGKRIGGFAVCSPDMGTALTKAGRNIEVQLRPDQPRMTVTLLSDDPPSAHPPTGKAPACRRRRPCSRS